MLGPGQTKGHQCALFSQGETSTVSYAQGLETSISGAVHRARESIKSFRTHVDVSQLLIDVSRAIAMPLKMSAYLMGHLDGLGVDLNLEDCCPSTHISELAEHFILLQQALRAAWENRASWDGLEGVKPAPRRATEEMVIISLPLGDKSITVKWPASDPDCCACFIRGLAQ